MFHLVNVGESAGTIIRSTIRLEIVGPERLLLHESVEPKDDLGAIKLGPGVARLFPFQDDSLKWQHDRFRLKPTTIPNETNRDFTIHFVGQVMYVDEGGVPRRTAFRRELIPERRRFYRIEGEPDLDYAG
jgi:hypothetical protein